MRRLAHAFAVTAFGARASVAAVPAFARVVVALVLPAAAPITFATAFTTSSRRRLAIVSFGFSSATTVAAAAIAATAVSATTTAGFTVATFTPAILTVTALTPAIFRTLSERARVV
ncbi:MAG TPA: hypothetical protein VE931_08800 [Pyrinomonadaceae bacterium]|nr:hypothetical protein [Pyrinomonadaceae bacterium]